MIEHIRGRVRDSMVAVILILLSAVTPIVADPSPREIHTDGVFDDWTDVPALIADDPADAAAGSAVDLGAVHVLDDPHFVYLTIETGRPVNAQRMRGTLRILLDGDGDAETGAAVGGLEGVDAIVELSRFDTQIANDTWGAGIGVRPVGADGPAAAVASSYQANLLVAPTVATTRLELRLARGTRLAGGVPLFAGERARLLVDFVAPGGAAGDSTAAAEARFATRYAPPPAPTATVPAKTEGAFRVVAWNVAGPRMRENADAFRRVLAALDPDVVLLDEVYSRVTTDDLDAFFGTPPLGASGSWHFAIGKSGGRQKNVVASRHPLRPEPALLDVAYPPGSLEALAADGDAGGDGEPIARVVALERRVGVATAGAWVRLPAGAEDHREVLFVPLDLQSGGWYGSFRDRLRELQATIIRDRIAAAAAGIEGPVPLVIGGDLNLVGSDRPLERLLSGAPGLEQARAERLGDRSSVTWRHTEGGPFGPGRLDFILYSPETFALDHAFVLDAGLLTPAELERLRLRETDNRQASDHLPVVADLRWR